MKIVNSKYGSSKNSIQKNYNLIIFYLVIFFTIISTADASERPEIIVEAGHFGSIIDLTSDGNTIVSISKVFSHLSIKLWDLQSGRLKKDILIKSPIKIEIGSIDMRVFLAKNNINKDLIILLVDQYKNLNLKIIEIDPESGLILKTLDKPYDIFLKELEILLRLRGDNSYYISERLEMVKNFGISMIYRLLEKYLIFLGYKPAIKNALINKEYKDDYKIITITKKYDVSDITIKTILKTKNINSVKNYPFPFLTNDNQNFICVISDDKGKAYGYGDKIFFYDIVTGKSKLFGETYPVQQEWVLKTKFDRYFASYDYRTKKGFLIWDLNEATLLKFNATVENISKYFKFVEKTKEGDMIVIQPSITSDNKKLEIEIVPPFAILYESPNKKELARFIAFTDGEWIVITPEGYYNASPNGDKYLNVRRGNNIYSIDNYREQFFRPDLVKLALRGHSLKDYKAIADVLPPPQIQIVDTPTSTDKDEVKVTVSLTDMGGGIGDIRLYLNDTSILLDSARGVKVTPKPGEKTIYKTYTIKLLEGENVIKAIAFNAEGSMASNPAVHKIVSHAKLFKKPSMYAVVIGINEFKNPKLELKYAVADAKLFAETLKQVAQPLFEKVNIKLLTTKEETTKENIKKTLESLKVINPEDVFIFYVASHGTVDDGEYFLITSNVGSLSTFRLKEDALTQAELKELIANIPSTKKMIIIDTCHAGKLGEVLQVAMMTRGMSEETAMKILSSAVGSTIISASTSYQEALEGYQGHGLFTYVITEGLRGKADTDKDGFIKTLELANYVDSQVPVLAEKIFKRAQYPTVQPIGQSFPVGKVK